MSRPVALYIYDLSNGMAKQLSRQLTGRQIDGIWHTSVVVFGREFFYGQGINVTPPGQSHHGRPLQILDMGETSIDEDTFNEYIEDMRTHYTAEKYHLLDFNCNSFTNDVVGFLTGRAIPSFVADLPTDFLSTPFGAALRPTIDAMYGRPSPGVASPAPNSGALIDPQATASILNNVANQASANRPSANGSINATASLTGPVHIITNPSSFRSLLSSHKAVVGFFTSSTCGPCRAIEPFFMKLAEEKGVKPQLSVSNGAAFAKIDIGVGAGQSLATEWRIRATPTFIFFLDGNKVQEIKGANSAELKTQVDLLLYQAYPPHPHTKLPLPLIQKISFSPILFTQAPSIDNVNAKLSTFINAATWPASASLSKADVTAIINNGIVPYLKSHFISGKMPEFGSPASPTLLTSWSQASAILISSIPIESLFPVVDLWRLLVLDPATGKWAASQLVFEANPLSLILAKAHSQKAAVPRSYLLTALRLSSNVFANAVIAQRLVVGTPKRQLTELVVRALLHDDVMVKNASASVIFNLAAVIQNNRVRSMRGVETQEKGLILMGDDEDWEIEIISAIIEALRREKDNEEFVHRLTAALAFVVRLSPFWDSLGALLEVLQCKEVLESKISVGEGWNGKWRNTDARKLVQEVVDLCHKLFDTYSKKLGSDDVNIFSEIAEKLASWLDNEKAYYDQARPEIVKLLITAQSTLQRAAGAADPTITFNISQCAGHPLVSPYVKLVKIVGQFIHLFVEKELEVNVRYLVNTISVPQTSPTQNPQTSQEQAPEIEPPQVSNITTVAKPEAMGSITVPPKGTTQKVKRKRKTLEELIDVDLRKFRETASHESTVSNIAKESSSIIVKKEVTERRDTGVAKINISAPLEATLPPNLSRKLSESTQGSRWGFIEGLSGDAKPVIGEPTSSNVGSLSPAGQKQPRNLLVSPGKTAAETYSPRDQGNTSALGTGHDQELQKIDYAPKPTVSGHKEANGAWHSDSKESDDSCTASLLPAVVAQNADFSSTRSVLSECVGDDGNRMQGIDEEIKEPRNAHVTIANDISQELAWEQIYSGVDQKDDHGEIPTQAAILGRVRELHTKLSLCASRIVRDDSLLKAIIADDANVPISEIRSLLALDDDKDPSLDNAVEVTDTMEVEMLQGDTLDLSDSNGHESTARFSPDRTKVLAMIRGLSNPGRVAINFNIKPAIHLALSRWTKRSRHGACDLDKALCITLGCYRTSETTLDAIPKDEPSRKEFIYSHQSSWPRTGDLQLLQTGVHRHSLPLSPPLLVTPDGLVDISHLLAMGANDFELHSTWDMSRYIFTLIVHPPTPAQLSSYNLLRKKEQDWKDWISSLSRPINVGLIPHSQ